MGRRRRVDSRSRRGRSRVVFLGGEGADVDARRRKERVAGSLRLGPLHHHTITLSPSSSAFDSLPSILSYNPSLVSARSLIARPFRLRPLPISPPHQRNNLHPSSTVPLSHTYCPEHLSMPASPYNLYQLSNLPFRHASLPSTPHRHTSLNRRASSIALRLPYVSPTSLLYNPFFVFLPISNSFRRAAFALGS
jgi:hypothetical protein